MKQDVFADYIDDLLADVKDKLKEECLRLYKSGAVNVDEYEDNYRLPKNILTAAFSNAVSWYRPVTDKDQRVVNNLKKF